MNETIIVISNVTNGLYLFRKELLERLVQRYDVVVLAGDTGNADKLRNIGCEVIITEIEKHGTSVFQDIQLYHTYLNLIMKYKPIVVLTYTIKPNVYGGLACQRLRIPYISNITGVGDAIENGGVLSKIALKLYQIGLKEARIVFFQNKANKDFFLNKKVYQGCFELLPGSGVNLELHNYEPYPIEDPEKPIIISVIGRITKDKGIDEILEVAEHFQTSKVIIRLIGDCADPYKERVLRASEKGVIEYVGKQQNIHEWYKISHAVLLASYHEGMSNVLLEAAACGRPVLASRIPGCIETFEEGKSGLGFKPHSANEITEVIKNFLEIPYSQKIQMGVCGRKRIERFFDRNIIVDRYMKVIESI